jgi:MFS family permease
MDISCLVGICGAAAQTDPMGAETTAANVWDVSKEISDAVTWLGIFVLSVSQVVAPLMLWLYRRVLQKLMAGTALMALGSAAAEYDRSWNADALLAGAERQRLLILRVLIGVVFIYSVVAALIFSYEAPTRLQETVSVLVSFFMFAAFSAPVVLLGVSAARFSRHFWTYFAPAAFAAVAMQISVASPPDEAKSGFMFGTLAGILLVTVVAVYLRASVPEAFWQRIRTWVKTHRFLAGMLVTLAVLVLAGVCTWRLLLEAERGRPAFVTRLLIACAISALVVALCYVTLVDRTKRIVVPLLAAALFTMLVLFFIVFISLDVSSALGLVGALVFALGVSALVGYFLLSWIGLAYEQKVFSDAQFQVFCWMTTIAGLLNFTEILMNDEVTLNHPLPRSLGLSTIAAMIMYWLLIRYLVRPMPSAKRLLVLRVFAKDNEDHRGERLLDELEYRWRFIGPIALIGAPDVAARTIDPAKAANFLRFKLKYAFIANRHELHKRIAGMDDVPDPDGRYRVNEFYCFDDVWKEAVQMLVDASDAILLDLRGFNNDRRGTAYEIGLLAGRGAVARTVFLVNAETNMADAMAALHAPPGSALPTNQVIEVESGVDGKVVFESLVRKVPAVLPPLEASRRLQAEVA